LSWWIISEIENEIQENLAALQAPESKKATPSKVPNSNKFEEDKDPKIEDSTNATKPATTLKDVACPNFGNEIDALI